MEKKRATVAVLNKLEEELSAVNPVIRKTVLVLFKGVRSGKVPGEKEAKKIDPSGGMALGWIAAMVSNVICEIEKHPPRNDAELEKWLAQMNGLRYKIRPVAVEMAKMMAALVPKKKRGPKGFTDAEKQQFVSQIETFIKNGEPTKDARDFVRKDWNSKNPSRKISDRNLRHIWQTKGLA